MYVCLYLSIHLSIHPSICLFIFLSVYLSICVSIYLFVRSKVCVLCVLRYLRVIGSHSGTATSMQTEPAPKRRKLMDSNAEEVEDVQRFRSPSQCPSPPLQNRSQSGNEKRGTATVMGSPPVMSPEKPPLEELARTNVASAPEAGSTPQAEAPEHKGNPRDGSPKPLTPPKCAMDVLISDDGRHLTQGSLKCFQATALILISVVFTNEAVARLGTREVHQATCKFVQTYRAFRTGTSKGEDARLALQNIHRVLHDSDRCCCRHKRMYNGREGGDPHELLTTLLASDRYGTNQHFFRYSSNRPYSTLQHSWDLPRAVAKSGVSL